MSDTVDKENNENDIPTPSPAETTQPAAETAQPPVEAAQPATVAPAQATQPTAVPPTGGGGHKPGWFADHWRSIVAAAAVVVVAGAFFTIGWFTSTRGDDEHFPFLREIREKMDLREWGFRQDGPGGRDSDRWRWPGCPQRRYDGLPAPQTPSTPQAPSTPQVPTTPQTPASQQAYLGVRVASVTPDLQQRFGLSSTNGALVVAVDHTGPAFQAGIRQGDLITGVDGTAVATPEDVISAVANKKAGDNITVVIDRRGETLTFQVTLAARPAALS